MWIITLQRLTLRFFFDIVYFPVWWYSKGILFVLSFIQGSITMANDQFVPFLWLKYIFVPMYGQYDWQGRLVSFFMRLVNIIVRSFLLLFWVILVLFFGLLWICLPILVVLGIIWSRL